MRSATAGWAACAQRPDRHTECVKRRQTEPTPNRWGLSRSWGPCEGLQDGDETGEMAHHEDGSRSGPAWAA